MNGKFKALTALLALSVSCATYGGDSYRLSCSHSIQGRFELLIANDALYVLTDINGKRGVKVDSITSILDKTVSVKSRPFNFVSTTETLRKKGSNVTVTSSVQSSINYIDLQIYSCEVI